MAPLAWDQTGEKEYETGISNGVLFVQDVDGSYPLGVAWNGLTAVNETPSGAESNKQYADNIVYLNLVSAEEFGGTIEAFMYPSEFNACDGLAEPVPGVTIGQQNRVPFGLAYVTIIGNDTQGTAFGKKLHLAYGALASPSEKAYTTVNDSPEATPFSWEFSTTPVNVGEINGVEYKPTALLTIKSTDVTTEAWEAITDAVFGTAGTDPYLPTPAEVIAMFDGALVEAVPTAPTYNPATGVITIPTVTGVVYKDSDNEVLVAGAQPAITEDTVIYAFPAGGYKFPDVVDNDWFYAAP